MYYVLDEHRQVKPTNDLMEWASFIGTRDRVVAQTRFECGVFVSTVFLGLDHRFGGKGPPLLFETLVFELTMDGDSDMQRYSSWDDAETGHRATVRRVKGQLEMAGLSTVEIVEA